jgi:hypothetical protein
MPEYDAIITYFRNTIQSEFKYACSVTDRGHCTEFIFGRCWIRVQDKGLNTWVVISCGTIGRFILTDNLSWAALKIEDHDSIIRSFTKACEIAGFYDELTRDTNGWVNPSG